VTPDGVVGKSQPMPGAVCELKSSLSSKDSKSTGSESASTWEASGENLESNGSSFATTFETKCEDGSDSSGESSETSWKVFPDNS
jgi:hypothetical protein